MKKLIYISIIFMILFSACFNINMALATEEDLEENTEATNVVYENAIDESTALSSLSSSSKTSVSSINTYSQANLEISNVLSVILIAVGVVIILLAIAILIKIK